MKVLQVLCGGSWGGGSVVVGAITRGLIERGDEVHVVCLDPANAQAFRDLGARIVSPPLWFHSLQPLDLVPFLYLLRLCRREKYDLVATHTSKGGFIGRTAARLAGAPHIVHHAHGFSFNKRLSRPAFHLFVMLEKLAASAGHFIISVNEQHRLMAIELGVTRADLIATVQNGIDVDSFKGCDREAARRALGLGDNDRLVGSVGRLAPQKGFVYFVRAAAHVLAAVPNARFILVGDGPLKETLETEVEKAGVSSRFRFLDFRKDIPFLLSAFDVFVLPSLWEGLSISLLEAMASGRPIVATDIDANREALEPEVSARFVPPADENALAGAIAAVLGDQGLAGRLGAAARRAAETRFSMPRMVEQNLAIYDRVTGTAAGDREFTSVPRDPGARSRIDRRPSTGPMISERG